MSGPIVRRDFRRPQIVWTGDHKLRKIGRQLEATQLTNRTIGPIASPTRSINEIIGLLGDGGGRVFLTEGEWIFNENLSTNRNSIHLASTSPGRTVFKRPLAKSSSTEVMSFTGNDVILDGIRFIDEGNSTPTYMISMSGQRCVIKNCVFEDVYGGIKITGDWCAIRDCTFITATGRAIEFSGTARNGIVIGNIIQSGGGDVHLGDSVTRTGVLYNVFDNESSGDVRVSYFADREIVTGSALNVVHSDQVQERY
tara:strand:+ start:13913 stop:14674 length:762 start_codon:yes stop_codon:yes gene_type:complete